MTKAESEKAIRALVHDWRREAGVEIGSDEMPDFDDFRQWLRAHGYGHYLNFRSTMGPLEDAEQWFDEELGQAWRN